MKRQPIDRYAGPTTLGIDVSAYQPVIDWPLVARSEAHFDGRSVGPVRFAVVRACDGVQTRRDSKPDPWAVRHLQGAHEAGLLVAAYFFLRAYHGALEQLELVLEVLRVAVVPIGFVAIDVEGRPDDPTTPDTDESSGAWWAPPDMLAAHVDTADVLDDVLELARRIRAEGHRPILYSGVAWHWHVAQRGLAPPLGELGDLWTPFYSRGSAPGMPVDAKGRPAPWPAWRLWQFAGSAALPGSVPGIPGAVDLNRFRGDEDELARWWTPTTRTAPPAPSPIEAAYADLLRHALGAKAVGDQDAAERLLAAAEGLGAKT